MRVAAPEDHRACAGKGLAPDCDSVTEPPSHPIPRGFAEPTLLAMALVAKFLMHQPLDPQSAAYAREGIETDTSTLADRAGACAVALDPIVQAIQAHVLSGRDALTAK